MAADSEDLTELHLADLHARAAEAGVNGYRMLRREDLIAELESPGTRKRSRWPRRKAPDVDLESETDELKVVTEDRDPPDAEPKPARRRGRRGGRGRGGAGREKLAGDGRGDSRRDERRNDAPEDEETEEITGILEITRQRHGFLSEEGSDDDIYVSASQVRRCEMKDGDEVTGPARAPRRGERHRALVQVKLVNGEEPVPAPEKKGGGEAAAKSDRFDSLTPAAPTRRIELPEEASTLVRAADLLAPLALGQRVLVSASPRSGRTTLLRDLAQALVKVEGLEVTVLLIDERPEEIPAWNEAVPSADLALAAADLSPKEQVKVARSALERVRKQAEDGADAVLLCDSLSRLAVAADGVDDVKRLFGSGRELSEEGAGSLTVIATTLGEGDDEGSAEKAVTTTETSIVTLDETLASEGITPALRFGECRAVGDDKILSDEEMDGLRHLRSSLSELVPPEAATLVREKLETSGSNADVLRGLA